MALVVAVISRGETKDGCEFLLETGIRGKAREAPRKTFYIPFGNSHIPIAYSGLGSEDEAGLAGRMPNTSLKGQSICGLGRGAIDWGGDLVHSLHSTVPNRVSYGTPGGVDPTGGAIENGCWAHSPVSGLRGRADQDGAHSVTPKELPAFVGPCRPP